MKRFVLLSFLLILPFAFGADEPEYRRGKYLRSEIRNTESREHFLVRLQPSVSSLLQFEFRKVKELKLHEVRLYETVQETVHANSGEGITQRGTVEYVVVPGKIYEGEHSERIEHKDDGPLKCTLFTLNGKTYSTDANGIWIDDAQEILAYFDDMRNKVNKLTFFIKELGEYSFEATRNFIRHEEENMPGVERPVQQDILEAMMLDYSQQRLSTNEGISVISNYKKKAKPGEVVPITFEVKNNGTRSTSNLVGRSFSSFSGMNGKLFYFGMIAPGQSRRFFRLMTVPEKKGPCYSRVSFWSTKGTIKEATEDVCIEVE